MLDNDAKILELKKRIVSERELIKEIKKRFQPITNCSLSFEGHTYNIHACSKKTLIDLLISLNTLRLSIEDLGDYIPEDFTLSGYSVEDWVVDIKSKIQDLNIKERENNLKKMENKLTNLLSEAKKTELEIEEIEKLLK